MMFDKHANLKYKFGNRHFWAEGYYVSTVGLNEETIKKYIQEQEKYDCSFSGGFDRRMREEQLTTSYAGEIKNLQIYVKKKPLRIRTCCPCVQKFK